MNKNKLKIKNLINISALLNNLQKIGNAPDSCSEAILKVFVQYKNGGGVRVAGLDIGNYNGSWDKLFGLPITTTTLMHSKYNIGGLFSGLHLATLLRICGAFLSQFQIRGDVRQKNGRKENAYLLLHTKPVQKGS